MKDAEKLIEEAGGILFRDSGKHRIFLVNGHRIPLSHGRKISHRNLLNLRAQLRRAAKRAADGQEWRV